MTTNTKLILCMNGLTAFSNIFHCKKCSLSCIFRCNFANECFMIPVEDSGGVYVPLCN